MSTLFSDRMQDVPRSFIREILKAAIDPDIISFAGGLPNRALFPVDELHEASEHVFKEQGRTVLQYSNSEGLIELRGWIADRYRLRHGIDISAEQILITSGSQQALDLIAKITLNDGDQVIMEEPGYLGAIQALSLYRPRFLPVGVSEVGLDIDGLQDCLERGSPKLMYMVPNFQNPTGITYPAANRLAVAELIKDTDTLLVEDDPYGELRFRGEDIGSFYHLLPDRTLLLGSFSKTVVPGFRLGWVAAPIALMDKLLIAKQATDLHTCNLTQAIITYYLKNSTIDDHIQNIRAVYGRQCDAMIAALKQAFPADVSFTRPDGGMFIWAQLPPPLTAMQFFEHALAHKALFVPGEPFYTTEAPRHSFRLNFSCVDEGTIATGIDRLAEAFRVLG
jgi:2-aminoadipate transaminase